MGRDDNTLFCLDITTKFLGTLLDDEAAEATKGNLLSIDEAFLHCFHETLYYRQNGFLFKTCLLGDLGNNLCFCNTEKCIVFVLILIRSSISWQPNECALNLRV